MAVEVYLHIVRAIGLPLVSKKDSPDAMVVLLGGKDKRKLGQTAVASRSSSPIFSTEFMTLLPSVQESLTLQVFHHNKIFKNELLGSALVDISTANAATGVEQRLKLDGASGELVVVLRVLPSSPNTVIDVSQFYVLRPYSPLRLHLERFVFAPGELVRGNVVLNGGSTGLKLDWIRLESCGKTHLEFRSAKSIGFPCRNDFTSNVMISPFDYVWWNVIAPVVGIAPDGRSGSKVELEPGVHVWPFEFVLPSYVAPTYTRVSFNTEYSIQLHASWGGKVSSAMKDICIVPPLCNTVPSLSSPVVAAIASDLVTPSPLQVSVMWKTPQTVFIGIPFTVDFQLQNGSAINFTELNCHLRTARIYNLQLPQPASRWVANKFIEECCVATVQGAQCSAAHMINAQVSMTAQNTQMLQPCYPSVPENFFSDLIQVHHYLELVGTADSGAKMLLGRQPIYLTYPQFYPPFATASEPQPTPQDMSPTLFYAAKADAQQALQLSIPLGHWVHMDYALTQEKTQMILPQNTNTGHVLTHNAFASLPPIKIEQTNTLASKTNPFPVDVPGTPITLEHFESFESSHAHRNRNDAGSVSINSNFGINLNMPTFGINDLNRQLFSGGFGK